MNGFFAFAGQFFMPVVQVALWVVGLQDRAQAEDGVTAPTAALNAASTDADGITTGSNQTAAIHTPDYLASSAGNTLPGSFPQLSLDVEAFSGTTDWEVTSADPTINAPTNLSSAYAQMIAQDDGLGFDLLVNVVVSDNNGLTSPQLMQAASDSLEAGQNFFYGPVTTDIDVNLISTTSAQIQWRGTLAADTTTLYYPLDLSVADREGFVEGFEVFVPILNSDFSL